MSKVMLINVSHEEESRVAMVEGGVLESLEIESISRSLKGNIYKGIVNNVNAALEAAFVNYGDERAGFLPLDEVNFKVLPVLQGREGHRRGRITDHLASGKEILVEVVRDAFNSKPPTLSTFYSLPGRYLVLTPKSDGQGISRKIEDVAQRERLRKIVEELNPPEGFGVIVRTAGMDQSRTELQRDLRYLLRLWEAIEAAAATHRAPCLIYQERDLVLRTIRDHFTPDIEEVLIDSEEWYEKARRFVQAVMPSKEKLFKLYTGDKPLFSKYNLEDQIESIFRREVTLQSGGAIVIDETEALTAVDVNSARSGREGNIEDTALKTNLEAAEETARQLRLRDLGGLVVVDFIDMYQDKNVRAVEKTMREALKKDKAKYDVTRISKFGLMEISRQRIKVAKASAAYTPCARCEGTGVVKTTEAAALSILRRIQARVVKGDLATLRATAPEEVAVYLLNQKREELSALERRYGTRISIVPHPIMNPNRAEIETVVRDAAEAPPVMSTPRHPAAGESTGAAPQAAAYPLLKGLSESTRPDEQPGAEPQAADVVVPESAAGGFVEEAPASAVQGTEAGMEVGPQAASGGDASLAASPVSASGRRRRRRRRRPQRGEPTPEEAATEGASTRETSLSDLSVEPPSPPPEDALTVEGVFESEEEASGTEEAGREQVAIAAEGQGVGLEVGALGAPPTAGAAASEQPHRRRRRRRRRSRRAAPAGAPGGGASLPAAPEEASGEGEVMEAGASSGPAGQPSWRGGREPAAEESRSESAPVNTRLGEKVSAFDQSQAGPRKGRDSSQPAEAGERPRGEKEEEDEVIGGWWQRLTGGSRRRGRTEKN